MVTASLFPMTLFVKMDAHKVINEYGPNSNITEEQRKNYKKNYICMIIANPI